MTVVNSLYASIAEAARTVGGATGLSFAVFDRSGAVLVATGAYAHLAGGRVPEGFPAVRVGESGASAFILPGREKGACGGCAQAGACDVRAEMFVPVWHEGEVVAVVGLAAVDEGGLAAVRDRQSDLLRLVDRTVRSALRDTLRDERSRDRHVYELYLRAALEGMDKPVFVVDEFGTVREASPCAAGVVSRTVDEVRGRQVETLLPGISFPGVLEDLKRHSRDKAVVTVWMEGDAYPAQVSVLRAGNRVIGALVLLDRPREEEGGSRERRPSGWGFDDIKGVAGALVEAKEAARRVAEGDSTVLLIGESGTGKELFARAIHYHSRRRLGPFVALNCAAIPESLLESELFGYEGGAFTGARPGGKMGKFEMASGGTVFLDEVGDMPLSLQIKLLRVLEDRRIERVGGLSGREVDIRLIAATHKDLESLVEKGLFREDLYYRLNVIPIRVPPLRERKEDIYVLLEYLFKKYRMLLGKSSKRLSAEVINRFFEYDWPGNVRELENTVEYIVNLEMEDVVTMKSLPPKLRMWRPGGSARSDGPGQEVSSLEELEEQAIREALEKFGTSGSGKAKAAAALGIHRATLYRKLKRLGEQAVAPGDS